MAYGCVPLSLGQSSVYGLPDVPQRASIEFNNPSIDRVNGPVETPLAKANHVELHGRIAEGAWLLMRTDWSKRRDPEAYQNFDDEGQHTPGPSCMVFFLI